MRKTFTLLSGIILWILLSVSTVAASNETSMIGTTVPDNHSISIQADHASALYLEGTKGESDAYVVPRLSEPRFQLSVEQGWTLERILLNGQDVTNQVTDGVLKLPPVCGDQVITLETKSTDQSNSKSEGSNDNSSQGGTNEEDAQNTAVTSLISRLFGSPRTGDDSILWYAVLLLTSCGFLAVVLWRRIRKTSR